MPPRTQFLRRRPLAICLLILALAGASSISATSVEHLDAAALVARSPYVIHASCIDRRSYRDGNGMVLTHYTFQVHETMKGEDAVRTAFVMPGGEAEGVATLIPGLSEYRRGDELILFLSDAYGAERERRLPLGMDQGVYRVCADPAGGAPIVARNLGALALVATREPAAPAGDQFPEGVTVAAFKDCVRDRVQSWKAKAGGK